jgi:hypothetical protein
MAAKTFILLKASIITNLSLLIKCAGGGIRARHTVEIAPQYTFF